VYIRKLIINLAVFVLVACIGRPAAWAQGTSGILTVTQPELRKVYQRNSANYSLVPIRGKVTAGPSTVQARAVVMSGGNGRETAWRTIATDVAAGAEFAGTLPTEAGGWYQVQVRTTSGSEVAVDRVGVGEVFITAGQSNAGNYGEGPTAAQDDRVSAWKGLSKAPIKSLGWQHADDPQPTASPFTEVRGSPWPAMCDILAKRLDVPIGLIAVARGGTTILDWNNFVTDVAYFQMRNALREVGPNGVRAILWHQGEADTVVNTTRELYQSRFKTLIAESRREAGWNVPWVVARASYVPWAQVGAVQRALFLDDPARFDAQILNIVQAQNELINDPANLEVYPGPSTNDIQGVGWRWDQLHMTVAGLHEHGRRWAETVLGPGIISYPQRDLAFAQPMNGATLPTLATMRGIVGKWFGSPELTTVPTSNPTVTLAIKRVSDGLYWNGATSTWGPAATLTASVSGTNWSVLQRLPSGDNLDSTTYQLTVRAQQTGHSTATPNAEETSITIRIAASSINIETPANNSTHCIITPLSGSLFVPLVAATGTANDGNGGSDIVSVTLRLRRTMNDGSFLYWGGGSSWTGTYVPAQHERAALGIGDWSLKLPTLEEGFVAGRYRLRAIATTSSGFNITAESGFTLANVFDLAGRVTYMDSKGGQVGLPGVTITRNGVTATGGTLTAVTNGAGYYKFTLVPGDSVYTLRPTMPGRVFTPITAVATVDASNALGPNFGTGYWVGGRIVNGSLPVEGVTVTRSGAENGSPVSTVTDVNGNYRLVNVPPGTFTVSPAKPDHLFTPANATAEVIAANLSVVNFTSFSGTTLGGRVTDEAGAGVAGVAMIRSGTAFPGSSLTVTTDNNGAYSFAQVPNGTIAVTPVSLSYRFTPSTKTVAISGVAVSGQNFVGLLNYSIHGRVTDAAGVGMANVTVQRNVGIMGWEKVSVVTNSAGYYTFNEVPVGYFTVEPLLNGLSVSPESRRIAVGRADVINQNFQVATGFRVSGRIANSTGVGLAGVSVARSGSATAVTTNGAGYYTFSNVPNGTLTITPSIAGQTVAPTTKTTTVNNADVVNQNFVSSN